MRFWPPGKEDSARYATEDERRRIAGEKIRNGGAKKARAEAEGLASQRGGKLLWNGELGSLGAKDGYLIYVGGGSLRAIIEMPNGTREEINFDCEGNLLQG